jgi:hypothetical protein
VPAGLESFRSTESRAHDGSIETEQRVLVPAPVVPLTEDGGRTLGRGYWLEVARVARGVVRARAGDAGVEIELAGIGLTLLALGPEEVTVESDRVTCRYPIRGGLLSGAAGGELLVTQTAGEPAEVSVAVSGFFARRGPVYRWLQRRLHVRVSRRYFRRLLAEDPA